MKSGIFTLTKNEQRVVILAMIALLAGAFARYWKDSRRQTAAPNPPQIQETATPFAMPIDENDLDAATESSSPQSSP